MKTHRTTAEIKQWAEETAAELAGKTVEETQEFAQEACGFLVSLAQAVEEREATIREQAERFGNRAEHSRWVMRQHAAATAQTLGEQWADLSSDVRESKLFDLNFALLYIGHPQRFRHVWPLPADLLGLAVELRDEDPVAHLRAEQEAVTALLRAAGWPHASDSWPALRLEAIAKLTAQVKDRPGVGYQPPSEPAS